MKKILFITTSHDKLGDSELSTGCYFPEVIIPYKKFTDEGLEVDFASPKGSKIPLIGFNEYDSLTRNYLENSEFMKKIKHSYKISEITNTKGNVMFPNKESFQLKGLKIDDYMAIYIPGGHGVMWDLPDNNHLQELISEFYESGGIIGAVCNGPAALVNVKLPTEKIPD